MKNYLTEVLAEIVDTDYLTQCAQLDEHLRALWGAKASEEFKAILETFESKPGDNPAAEFTVYLLLTEAMLDDVRTEQGTGGLSISEADQV